LVIIRHPGRYGENAVSENGFVHALLENCADGGGEEAIGSEDLGHFGQEKV
jgi:hypothetical protein